MRPDRTPSRPTHPGTVLGAILLILLVGCQAVPPAHRVPTELGAVRADELARAQELAAALTELAPRVAELLPASRPRPVDVWVQEEPRLFRFGKPAHQEADGFWALGPRRIHLREGADDLRRTLAHELTHAFLGREWEALPGTLEEGLCDLLSALAVPEGALRMRAGRLSAAAFCLGGLALRIEVGAPGPSSPQGLDLAYAATVVLEGLLDEPLSPWDVFRERAGLSTARMGPARKKALYGLAYLVVVRASERIGLEGLLELCRRARAEGLARVPEAWLLEAAELCPVDVRPWRRALEDELGPQELRELVAMYPEFLVSTVEQLVPHLGPAEALSVRLSSGGSGPALELVLLPSRAIALR